VAPLPSPSLPIDHCDFAIVTPTEASLFFTEPFDIRNFFDDNVLASLAADVSLPSLMHKFGHREHRDLQVPTLGIPFDNISVAASWGQLPAAEPLTSIFLKLSGQSAELSLPLEFRKNALEFGKDFLLLAKQGWGVGLHKHAEFLYFRARGRQIWWLVDKPDPAPRQVSPPPRSHTVR